MCPPPSPLRLCTLLTLMYALRAVRRAPCAVRRACVLQVRAMETGWRVDFGLEPALGLPNQTVNVPASRLLLGLGNGWTGQGGCVDEPCKALWVEPEALKTAWAALGSRRARGLFFWDIGDEGLASGVAAEPIYLARTFNEVLGTRGTRGEGAAAGGGAKNEMVELQNQIVS